MKSKRHQIILSLINEEKIDTQENLQAALLKKGIKVTQATVSRDIRELSLIKTITPTGDYKYSVPSLKRSGMENGSDMVLGFITDSVKSVDYAGNTVVIKCYSGMAQAVCAKLDDSGIENVVGSLAGDDTIFLLMRSEKDADRLLRELNAIISAK